LVRNRGDEWFGPLPCRPAPDRQPRGGRASGQPRQHGKEPSEAAVPAAAHFRCRLPVPASGLSGRPRCRQTMRQNDALRRHPPASATAGFLAASARIRTRSPAAAPARPRLPLNARSMTLAVNRSGTPKAARCWPISEIRFRAGNCLMMTGNSQRSHWGKRFSEAAPSRNGSLSFDPGSVALAESHVAGTGDPNAA